MKYNVSVADMSVMPKNNREITPNCKGCDHIKCRHGTNLQWTCDFCSGRLSRLKLGIRIRSGGGCCVKTVHGKRVEYPTHKEAYAIRKSLPEGDNDTWRLWALGKTDSQIAKKLKVHPDSVAAWRRLYKVPANRR